jgi:tetratricopeptide (TPR) repeat protein
VSYDQNNETQPALNSYKLSIDHFLQYLKAQTPPHQYSATTSSQSAHLLNIRETIQKYLQRAEYLSQRLQIQEHYDQGVRFISQGIDFDKRGEFENAFQAFSDGIELVLKYVSFENNSQNIQIMKQLEHYLDRVEILKQMISNKSSTHSLSQSELVGEETQPPSAPSSPVSMCVVCLSSPAVFAMIPCGHLILCEDCLKDHSSNLQSCYLCRVELTPPKYLRVFTT